IKKPVSKDTGFLFLAIFIFSLSSSFVWNGWSRVQSNPLCANAPQAFFSRCVFSFFAEASQFRRFGLCSGLCRKRLFLP
ncbi:MULTISPECIES: hypothetical protein, partial [unclassified Pseudomonas]|uniref:hypothetical protein n=1 Tax=unclassified Pseudomonas TaxID=196821 RepID=UPI0019D38CB8